VIYLTALAFVILIVSGPLEVHAITSGIGFYSPNSYYLFFKPLPIGHHKIELEVIRDPLEANAPVEHDVAKWDIQVAH
jgi:hypothetical protein